MLKKLPSASWLLLGLLSACSTTGPQPASGMRPTEEPAVAIARIGGLRAGAAETLVDAREPRSGPLLIAASTQYDPVTGQTSSYPVSVLVTASDGHSLTSVELLHNGVSVGTYVKGTDAQAFGNPFVFPAPQSGTTSLPVPGTQSGLASSQLQAVARNASGQRSETAVLEVQADGSRPNLEFAVFNNGVNASGPVQLNARAFDPESGIRSFAVFLNDEEQTLSPATSASFSAALELSAGTYVVRLVAVNGVGVANEIVRAFDVAEPPDGDDGTPTTPPTEPPTTPPTEPVDPPTEPPTEPVDPPTEPVEPPTEPPTGPPSEPGPPTDPTDPENGAPTVGLRADPTEGASPLTVTFTADASDPDGDELTYRWDFGDGRIAHGGVQQTYTYGTPGTYTASVLVRDGNGGRARAEVEIIVSGDGAGGDEGNQPPVVTLTATPTAGPAPLSVTFTADASDPDGDELNYVWNFGDNKSVLGGTTQEHTYTAANTYVASVTVTDGRGGKATVEVTITVN